MLANKEKYVNKESVAEMRMPSCMSNKTRSDKVRNGDRDKQVVLTEDRIKETVKDSLAMYIEDQNLGYSKEN